MLRDFWSDFVYRMRALFQRDRVERDLTDELRFHLETETARRLRDGLTPDEAGRSARLAFGPVEAIKDETRDSHGTRTAESIGRDLARAFRLAFRQPGFTAVVALSLALGIGATAAVFNLSYNLLFAPLSLPHPEQLVSLERTGDEGSDNSFTWAEYQGLRQVPGVGAIATVRSASAIAVAAGERRDVINMHFVDGDYLRLTGVRPLRGRLLTPGDDAQQAAVVVLAAWFADKMFPGDTAVVGRTLLIRGAPFTVVGVLPRSFHGLEFPGWFTAAIPERSTALLGAHGPGSDNRGQPYGAGDARASRDRTFRIVGRITVPLAQARRALMPGFARCCTAPGNREALSVIDISRGIPGGKNDPRPGARMILAILGAAMLLVLVVACCNVASLLLVRATNRQREIAVRLSLGASRGRLVAQLLAESVPHALLGALGGILFAGWYTSVFVRGLPNGMLTAGDAADMLGLKAGPMFAFTMAITLASGLAFAVYPALRATRLPLANALRVTARSSRTRRQGAIARAVVVAQVAATLMLVTAAALVTTTLGKLNRVTGGFATDHRLVANLEARSTPYEQSGVVPLSEAIVDRVRLVPRIRNVAMTTSVPIWGGSNWEANVRVPGENLPPRNTASARLAAVTPGFFATAGITLIAGRDFTTSDRGHADIVAIVGAEFARRHFGAADALGRSFEVALGGSDTLTTVRVVGVARDARYISLRDPAEPMVYVPLAEVPGVWHGGQLEMQTAGDPLALVTSVRGAIEAAAPEIGIRRIDALATARDESLVLERLGAQLAAFISVMALLLSAVGLYGVVAYSVARRTGEIGVRRALGAQRNNVLWLVARETLVLLGIGVLIGVPLSLVANGALRGQLYGIGPHDPVATVVAIGLLMVAGVLAATVPASRALRVDPASAMRAE